MRIEKQLKIIVHGTIEELNNAKQALLDEYKSWNVSCREIYFCTLLEKYVLELDFIKIRELTK